MMLLVCYALHCSSESYPGNVSCHKAYVLPEKLLECDRPQIAALNKMEILR